MQILLYFKRSFKVFKLSVLPETNRLVYQTERPSGCQEGERTPLEQRFDICDAFHNPAKCRILMSIRLNQDLSVVGAIYHWNPRCIVRHGVRKFPESSSSNTADAYWITEVVLVSGMLVTIGEYHFHFATFIFHAGKFCMTSQRRRSIVSIVVSRLSPRRISVRSETMS